MFHESLAVFKPPRLFFFNFIYDILNFYFVFQNYDVIVIRRVQWLISTDIIVSTKLLFLLKFGFGTGCSPAAPLSSLGCATGWDKFHSEYFHFPTAVPFYHSTILLFHSSTTVFMFINTSDWQHRSIRHLSLSPNLLCCRGTRQKEEASPGVAPYTFLQTEDAAGTNPARRALHQETSHIRGSAVAQPREPSQTMQATPWA